jgi:hypothetical protein
LALTVERTEYEADEPIAVVATFAYGGPKASQELSGSGRGPIIFMIEQTDGPFDPGSSFTHECALHVLERDIPLVLPLQKSGGGRAMTRGRPSGGRGTPNRSCAYLLATMSSQRSSNSS